MALTQWPFFEDRLRWSDDLLRSLAPLLNSGLARSAGVFPAVNIYDDGQAFLVRAELPAIDKDSIDVTVKGDQLTLRGERRLEQPEQGANYHRREREAGQFRRVVTLPQRVDADRIAATFKNGVLEVTLPRLPEAQPRKISVN